MVIKMNYFNCRLIRQPLRMLMLFVVMAFYSTTIFSSEESTERENKIKIAYLFHFSQFTEWETKPPVFTYCVYEDAHFTQLLKQAYAGKTLGSSQIEIQSVNEKSNFDVCQLLYFSSNVPVDLLASIKKKPILTVGEQKAILDQGMIYLFEDNQKIRFFINNSQAISVGLKINSQLLSLSKEP